MSSFGVTARRDNFSSEEQRGSIFTTTGKAYCNAENTVFCVRSSACGVESTP
jgi:hypothetical protein